MDALSDVLSTIDLSGVVFLRGDFHGEYGLVMPPPTVEHPLVRPMTSEHRLVMFHIVQKGGAYLEVEGFDPVWLATGDLVILFDDRDHSLADTPGRRTVHSSEVVPQYPNVCAPPIVYIGEGALSMRIVCGMLQFVDRGFNPLFESLPAFLHISSEAGPPTSWLQENLQHLLREAENAGAGSDALLNRLTEVLFVETLRCHLQGLPRDEKGWLAALNDAAVGQALHLLHESPAHGWSVAELAQRVGLSRSALSARFGELLGTGPIGYLARWRIRLATNLLDLGDESIAHVASRVGYESEPAFSRAFKREMGVAPSLWRNARRQSA
jgi:AraC-like DNA-binding protein